jgi:hypothetical protein
MIRVEFCLTMPGRGSWNQPWSGDGRSYLLVRDVEDGLARKLDGQSWSYAWAAGWRAEIRARVLAEDETLRPSDGFRGYDWMVVSILRYGKIWAPHEVSESPSTCQEEGP